MGLLICGLVVIGQPAVHPMCVKGLCLLTVLSGLAASGETTVKCECVNRGVVVPHYISIDNTKCV